MPEHLQGPASRADVLALVDTVQRLTRAVEHVPYEGVGAELQTITDQLATLRQRLDPDLDTHPDVLAMDQRHDDARACEGEGFSKPIE